MREIAERLGLPEGTVKSRTWYALRSLRLVLEEMGVRCMTARPRGSARCWAATSSARSSPTRPTRVRDPPADCASLRAPSTPSWPGCRTCSTSPSRPAPARRAARPQPSRSALLDRFARERALAPREPRRWRLPRIAWTRPRVALASAAARRRARDRRDGARDHGRPAAGAAPVHARAAAVGRRAPACAATSRSSGVNGGTVVRLWANGLQPGRTRVYEMLCGNARTGPPARARSASTPRAASWSDSRPRRA